jgi:thiamine-monophosphate kinase
MKLSEIGEFGFIERFSERFRDLEMANTKGIGDDCAIMPLDEEYEQVVTTDLLVEEIHFLKASITPFALGHKSLAVNLSDIAAMGATAVGSFLSLAIPEGTSVEYLDAFMEGYYQLSKKFGVALLGGDTTRSPDRLVINVCVIGRAPKGGSRLRSMAKPDDVVAVTGHLGNSGGGLRMILEKLEGDAIAQRLLEAHNLPQPALEEGRWLAGQAGVHAMMDLSDGMVSDLRHILKSSAVSATIEVDKLPVSEALHSTAQKFGWNPLELAASGGEDYELLVTVAKTDWAKTQLGFQEKFGKPLYPVGQISSGAPHITWLNQGKEVDYSKSGFNHFKSTP